MSERWRYQPEAQQEVVETAQYYERQRRGLGDEFVDALERALLRAVSHVRREPLYRLGRMNRP